MFKEPQKIKIDSRKWWFGKMHLFSNALVWITLLGNYFRILLIFQQSFQNNQSLSFWFTKIDPKSLSLRIFLLFPCTKGADWAGWRHPEICGNQVSLLQANPPVQGGLWSYLYVMANLWGSSLMLQICPRNTFSDHFPPQIRYLPCWI